MLAMLRPMAAALIMIAGCFDGKGHDLLPGRSASPRKNAPPQASAFRVDLSPTDTSNAALFSSYSSTSPHWPHIRPMVTDFRTSYLPPPKKKEEIEWMAAHFDYVMSGDGSAYKELNPGITYLPYGLLWTVYIPGQKQKPSLESAYYEDMEEWYRGHSQYDFESAFLHQPGSTKTPENRVRTKIWDSYRHIMNVGDSGVRAYEVDRLTRVLKQRNSGGVFLDEFGSGDMASHFKGGGLEVRTFDEYATQLTKLLRDIKQAFGPKLLMINTGPYLKDIDRDMVLAAGSTHMEKVNDPLHADMGLRWRFIDTLLAGGASVELVATYTWQDLGRSISLFRTLVPGNSSTRAFRMKMWELGSYYMLVPDTPDRLMLDMQNFWSVPFSTVWFKAQEVNIGHPRGRRTVYQTGSDSTGRKYNVFGRNFDRALVLVRPVVGYDSQSNGDSTAVTVPLPQGATWRLLREDGTLGAPVTSVALRNPEAAILVRGAP